MNYADSSLLISLYLPEPHSEPAWALLQKSHGILYFTPLHRAEWENALAQLVFRGAMTEDRAAGLAGALDSDLLSGGLAAIDMPPGAWGRCADLARRHGRQLPIRTLDTLHVACALEMGTDELWTFDRRQAALAARVGLKVRP